MSKLKIIYEPSGPAREYAAMACNFFVGCRHGCRYCYGKDIARCDLEKWRQPRQKMKVLEKLEADAEQLSGDPRVVLFSFMTDPYFDKAAAALTREALLIMERYDCRATVLTKAGGRAVQDFDILQRNGYPFGTSLVFINDADRAKWEPFAGNVGERMGAIVRAHAQGIKTWVSVEPVIDPDQALEVIEYLADVVDVWKVGKINKDSYLEAPVDWRRFRRQVEAKLSRIKTANPDMEFYIKRSLRGQ